VESVPLAIDHDRVSGVISALVADNRPKVLLLSESIYDFPFAFIAPLSAKDD